MQTQYGRLAAMACIRGENGIRGAVRFYQNGDGVTVAAEIFGLKDGFHGFHIHTGTSCDEPKGHFNPEGRVHPEHDGDLPSLLSCGGKACLTVRTDRFCIRDVLGRTVIVHENRDDFTTQPSGNSGAMIACGTIERC